MTNIDELKKAHRATWAAGEYAAVAEHIDEAPPRSLLEKVPTGPGQDVLDVATGTGNLALQAAAAGARVVGLDLTPELFEEARRRAADAGAEIGWVEGDAEQLPFEDASFDRVYSVFGVQFAPRHAEAAAEIARVCRPGGRIGIVNWTPAGAIGELFKVMGGYMPALPDYASPPPLWGNEEHVRSLFEGTGIELEFSNGSNPWRFDAADDWVAFMETRYGPTIKAREKLSGEGRWDECRAEILAMAERRNEADDGSFLMPAEYVVIAGRKEG